MIVEPGIGPTIARGIGSLEVPLQKPLSIRETPIVLCDLRRREEEDLGLDIGHIDGAILYLGRGVSVLRRIGRLSVLMCKWAVQACSEMCTHRWHRLDV